MSCKTSSIVTVKNKRPFQATKAEWLTVMQAPLRLYLSNWPAKNRCSAHLKASPGLPEALGSRNCAELPKNRHCCKNCPTSEETVIFHRNTGFVLSSNPDSLFNWFLPRLGRTSVGPWWRVADMYMQFRSRWNLLFSHPLLHGMSIGPCSLPAGPAWATSHQLT